MNASLQLLLTQTAIGQVPGQGGPPIIPAGVGQGGPPPIPPVVDPFQPVQPGGGLGPVAMPAANIENYLAEIRASLQLYGYNHYSTPPAGGTPPTQNPPINPLTGQRFLSLAELSNRNPELFVNPQVTALIAQHKTQYDNLRAALHAEMVRLGTEFNDYRNHARQDEITGLATQIREAIEAAQRDPNSLNAEQQRLLQEVNPIMEGNQRRDSSATPQSQAEFMNGIARQILIRRAAITIINEHTNRPGNLLSAADIRTISDSLYADQAIRDLGIRETSFEQRNRDWATGMPIRTYVQGVAAPLTVLRYAQNGRYLANIWGTFRAGAPLGEAVFGTGRVARCTQWLCNTTRLTRVINGVRGSTTLVRAGGMGIGRVAALGGGRAIPALGCVLAVADCAMDIRTAIQTGRGEDIACAAINVGCTGAGAIIGACIGGPLGAMVGAGLGNLAATGINFLVRKVNWRAVGSGIATAARAVGNFFAAPFRGLFG